MSKGNIGEANASIGFDQITGGGGGGRGGAGEAGHRANSKPHVRERLVEPGWGLNWTEELLLSVQLDEELFAIIGGHLPKLLGKDQQQEGLLLHN